MSNANEPILSDDEILALFKSTPQEDVNQSDWLQRQRIAIGRTIEKAVASRCEQPKEEPSGERKKPDYWIYQSISAPWDIYASDVRQVEPVLGYREIPVRATLAKEPPENPLQDGAVRHSSPAREIALSLVAGILARASREEGAHSVPENAGAGLIPEIVDRIWDLKLAELQFLGIDESSFELWFADRPAAGGSDKQRARDAYAAGMADPLARMSAPFPGDTVHADFLEDLARSRRKYPGRARMFDALVGELSELRRAYAGDGDPRAEALDVAVCAFRIAAEGDAGGNLLLDATAGGDALDAALGELAKECVRLQFKLHGARAPESANGPRPGDRARLGTDMRPNAAPDAWQDEHSNQPPAA